MNRRTLIGGFIAGAAAVLGKWTAHAESKSPSMIEYAEMLVETQLATFDHPIVIGRIKPDELPWSYQALDTLHDPNKVVDFTDKGIMHIGDAEHIHLGPSYFDMTMNLTKIKRETIMTAYDLHGNLHTWHIWPGGAEQIR